MQNTSSLSIDYSVRLESLSLLRHAHAQEIPPFLDKNAKPKSLVGKHHTHPLYLNRSQESNKG